MDEFVDEKRLAAAFEKAPYLKLLGHNFAYWRLVAEIAYEKGHNPRFLANIAGIFASGMEAERRVDTTMVEPDPSDVKMLEQLVFIAAACNPLENFHVSVEQLAKPN